MLWANHLDGAQKDIVSLAALSSPNYVMYGRENGLGIYLDERM